MMKSKQQIIDDGQEAKGLLDDTDLSRFLDEIKGDCWVQFEATALDDREGREAIYMTLRGVETVRQSLRAMVDNATIEKREK